MELEEVNVSELLQQPDGANVRTSGNHTREGNGSDRLAKWQHAGGERVVRLIEDILADPRATAVDTAEAEQSDAAGFNELVHDPNDSMANPDRSVKSTEGTLNLESPQQHRRL